MGRVLTKKVRADTVQEVVTTNTYDEERTGYHNVGRLTTAFSTAATIKYDYDKDGRVKRQTHTVGGVNYVTSSAYDIGGRLLSITYPDGQTVGTMAYDPAGRLLSVPGLLEGTTYTARNQPDQVNRPGTADTDYTYSGPRGWLERIVTTGVQDITYTRDVAGRITKIASTTPGESWSYGYDDLDRLTCANNFSGPPLSTCVAGQGTSLSQTFTYDSVGNMLSNSALGAYIYPLPGAARPHAVTQAGTRSYSYDANGNMTNNAGQSITYDGEGRPVDVGGTQFVYGPDGARLKKTDGGVTTLYFGADVELTGTTWTKYLPGDAIRIGTTTKWLHRDHLNSVRGYTDSAGVLKERANFRPYGERLVTLGIISASKGFIGERHDDETGLIYLNARYYDPVLARFIQPDPLDPSLPGVDVNRYAYAGNNPIGRVDTSGLYWDNDGERRKLDGEIGQRKVDRETGEYRGPEFGREIQKNAEFERKIASLVERTYGVETTTLHLDDGTVIVSHPVPANPELTVDICQGGGCDKYFKEQVVATLLGGSIVVAPEVAIGVRVIGVIAAQTARFTVQAARVVAAHVASTASLVGKQIGANLKALGSALRDLLGPSGPIFGRARRGGSSIFNINSNDVLRIGWGWKGPAATGKDVFRISGDLVERLGIRSGHIDLF